ncbi:uncharacterized protein LOC106139142 [Amyelois transitella]|uniref:uncharacterized protein LOC106139142 n=1 Tax=Amyelois transitella TaxID=680683 RepID=UPI00067C5A3D|nr:uncharacterized protein LOC106139142 [Amyelois transitella]
MKRTPPPTPNSVSAPNISTLESDLPAQRSPYESVNITQKSFKRPRDEFGELKGYLLDIIIASKQEQNYKLNTLISSVTEIKEQNNDIRNSVEFVSARYDEIATREYIKQLEAKVENLERQLKSSSIELRNIPSQINETKEDLINIVKAAGTALDLHVETSTIKDVYRVHGKTNNKTIVAELNSVVLKENLIKAVKNHNKKNPEKKFSTANLKVEGPSIPVYLSESLPAKSRKLFYLARNTASASGFKYCWTHNGRVFLRKTDGSPLIRVECEEDINSLAIQ